MTKSNRAGPELRFSWERASAPADAILHGVEAGAFEVARDGEARALMIALDRDDPAALDAPFLGLKFGLGDAAIDHSAR
ncbi:hypothetical protein [Paraburkholderia largidicola]|uniref:Uncharacterized protein n=1 Tax=Paraburkholderia largidicola TaxID=3014751 RepID=A0A7I8C1Z8_9BURK|nr:hypothetical protein [Paraburkholderia sp. PGU16]BCF95062.1 hypothetical protein PPGU16_81290 [Paraburkholderia sp. PGU16]